MAKGISVAVSVVLLFALVGCGEEGNPAAPRSPQTQPSPPPTPTDFSISLPATATLNQSRVTLECTVTSNGGATVVDLRCANPPDGVPCELNPSQVSVPAGGSVTANLRFDMAFLAPPDTYTVEVSGVETGGTTRSAEVDLTVTDACSGFMEQPSYTGNGCRTLGICLGFGNGYVYLAQGERYISGWSSFSCGTYTVAVGHGSQTDYQHPQGTDYMKLVPR